MSDWGILGAIVWPTYLGIASGDPGAGPVPEHEPFGDLNYERGQIHWKTESGMTYGNARVLVPAGIWTHYIFCLGPIQEMQHSPSTPEWKMEHPIVFDRPGYIDVDPIEFQEVLPRL